MQDEDTGQLRADLIGAFVDFEKINDEYGVSLYGLARIPKRDPEVLKAIRRLYEAGELNCSFEIWAEEQKRMGSIVCIDAAPGNHLTAMAIVSVPAYPESKVLALVAEVMGAKGERLASGAEDARKGQSGIAAQEKNEHGDGQPEGGASHAAQSAPREGDGEMDLMETTARIAQLEAQLNKALQENEKAQSRIRELEGQLDMAAEQQRAAEAENAREAVRLQEAIDALNAQVQELLPFKQRLEEIESQRMAQELQKKRDNLRGYAAKNGLDPEDAQIMAMIEAMDYEGIIAEIQKKELSQSATVAVAAFTDIKPANSRYGALLERC